MQYRYAYHLLTICLPFAYQLLACQINKRCFLIHLSSISIASLKVCPCFIRNIFVRDDPTARKGLIRAECIPEMKRDIYRIVLVVKYGGDIEQACCGRAAGKGPKASCKHIAALCYALEDFIRKFVKAEDGESTTDKIQQWNRTRKSKLAPAAISDIHLKRHRKEKVVKNLAGKQPPFYELGKICETDEAAAKALCQDLASYQETTGKKVGLLRVVNRDAPVRSTVIEKPAVGMYLEDVAEKLQQIKSSGETE